MYSTIFAFFLAYLVFGALEINTSPISNLSAAKTKTN